MNKLRVEITPARELSSVLRAQIIKWLISEFVEEGDETTWADMDWHVLGWVGDELVSHVDIIHRQARVGGSDFHLGGIGGVMTKEAWRGRGFSSKLMKESHRFMRDGMDVDFGLLLCDDDLVSFYAGLGWQRVDNPLVYEQPGGNVTTDDVVMVLLCNRDHFPEGEINLKGYPW
jgi:predicted GNAT family N-acyltransferase